jgi:haloalkane dehalogenase
MHLARLDRYGKVRSHPDIAYRYDDHYRYVSGFIDALGIGSNLTLVVHDWGSGLGFRWAHEHESSVKAIAFMEAMLFSLTWDLMPANFRMPFRMMRSPGIGWLMISVANIFIKKMLPDMVYRGLSPEAQAHYASAFPSIASRKAVRQWPLEIPIDGKPADNMAAIKAYGRVAHAHPAAENPVSRQPRHNHQNTGARMVPGAPGQSLDRRYR